jgi:hypothetical protein
MKNDIISPMQSVTTKSEQKPSTKENDREEVSKRDAKRVLCL